MNQPILPALVPGLVRSACIVSSGILGMGSLLRGCWLLEQRLGYVELMYFGGGGRRRRFHMGAWRTSEWRMATRWRLNRRRKILTRDLLVKVVSVRMKGPLLERVVFIYSSNDCPTIHDQLWNHISHPITSRQGGLQGDSNAPSLIVPLRNQRVRYT